MEGALALLNYFRIPSVVYINKYDSNRENTSRIVEFCEFNSIEATGKPVVEYSPKSMISKDIAELWNRILKCLDMRLQPNSRLSGL